MKPKLKAPKEWPYRVILCDALGRYVFDDVALESQVVEMIRSLILELAAKRKDD